MKGLITIYQEAYTLVDAGWCQKVARDEKGHNCLVMSLLIASEETATLPVQVQEEVIAKIKHSPFYWICGIGSPTRQERIERWNDNAWRRKSRILKLLQDLAAAHPVDGAQNDADAAENAALMGYNATVRSKAGVL